MDLALLGNRELQEAVREIYVDPLIKQYIEAQKGA